MAKMNALMPKELVKKARIQQVKFDGHKVTIIYTLDQGDAGDDVFTQECHDQPTKAFKSTLEALAKHVALLTCMTPAEAKKVEDSMEIRGVNFRDQQGQPMASVICVRQLQIGRALNFNTPFLATFTEEPSDVKLPNDFCDALDAVKDQAKKYIGGDRLQPQLPFPESDKSEKPAEVEE